MNNCFISGHRPHCSNDGYCRLPMDQFELFCPFNRSLFPDLCAIFVWGSVPHIGCVAHSGDCNSVVELECLLGSYTRGCLSVPLECSHEFHCIPSNFFVLCCPVELRVEEDT